MEVVNPKVRGYFGSNPQPKQAISNWCCHLANKNDNGSASNQTTLVLVVITAIAVSCRRLCYTSRVASWCLVSLGLAANVDVLVAPVAAVIVAVTEEVDVDAPTAVGTDATSNRARAVACSHNNVGYLMTLRPHRCCRIAASVRRYNSLDYLTLRWPWLRFIDLQNL